MTLETSLSAREQKVLDAVIEILKERLRPNRIILFGSRAKGTSHAGSDFDLAVDVARPGLTLRRQIMEAIGDASGLYSVDVVYLNSVDEDFKNLVLKTGRTVYERSVIASAAKQSREGAPVGHCGGSRFMQAAPSRDCFSALASRGLIAMTIAGAALDRLGEGAAQAADELDKDGVIQRFEFTFELMWKALRLYLETQGLLCKTPRECLKAAFRAGLLEDEELFLNMLADRNSTSHIYSKEESEPIFLGIRDRYIPKLTALEHSLRETIGGER
ncbi:MAG: nucleotidyltransferase substrate binding protein [Chloroflexi bacterium]|nr:nucleotidyltransferase substrate binding protein [Chloroflexota bacterium]